MLRKETGPVRFGEKDWAGVFIRGDEAMHYAMQIELLLDQRHSHIDVISLRSLRNSLQSCNEQLGPINCPVVPVIPVDPNAEPGEPDAV